MKYPGQIGSLTSSTAAADKFLAPDSLASRPNPESLDDRPRTPLQVPKTVLESNLKGNP
jgi:hypothetical protein